MREHAFTRAGNVSPGASWRCAPACEAEGSGTTPVEAKFQTLASQLVTQVLPRYAGPAGSCQSQLPNFDSTTTAALPRDTAYQIFPFNPPHISASPHSSSFTANMAKGKGGGGGDNLGSKKAQGQARKADAANAKKAAAQAKEDAAESAKWEKGAKSNAKACVVPPHTL